MRSQPIPPTVTDLVAASTGVLEAGGYQLIREAFQEWDTPATRLFEDAYNVVGIAAFPTCTEMLRSWAGLQGALVDVISRQVGRAEGKAWDGYLVLLTPGIAPSEDLEVDEVRSDTTHVRKLVATGDDLVVAGDVERVLRPLLPLQPDRGELATRSALDLLPDLLVTRGVERETTSALVRAFADQKPLMEALHADRGRL